MRDLGQLGRELILPQYINQAGKDGNSGVKEASAANNKNDIKYSIDEILDRVEEGDISVLDELGISYTEITTETGDKKISFKYENTRYTVHVIGSSNESEEKISNEELIQNAFAYDGADTLQNSTKLQYDYIIDKPLYYTFNIPTTGEPNSQITGKGSYGTGRVDDYTAIYGDDGSLVKIETSSSKYGNKEVVYNYNPNGEITEEEYDKGTGVVITTTYNADGSIKTHSEYMSKKMYEKGESVITREYTYSVDEQGQPVQTMNNSTGITVTTTRNADGTYTQNKVMKSEEQNEVKDDEKTLDELNDLIEECRNQANDIREQMNSLEYPISADFYTSSGDFDEAAYNKAKEEYQNKYAELHTLYNSLQSKLIQLDTQRTELQIKNSFEAVENLINTLKSSENSNSDLISTFEASFNNIKEDLEALPSIRADLSNELINISNQMFDMQIPVPPTTGNFLNADGSVNEEEYNAAMKEYEQEISEYNQKSVELNQKADVIHTQLNKIYMEINRKRSNLNMLVQNANTAANLQNLINTLEASDDNKEIISTLQNKLAQLNKNIKRQNRVLEYISDVENTLNNMPVPVPPFKNDFMTENGYDEEAYNAAFAKYEEQKQQYDTEIKRLNRLSQNAERTLNNLVAQAETIEFEANTAVIKNKINQLREAGKEADASALEEKLNKYEKEYNSNRTKQKNLENRVNMLIRRAQNLQVPTPPNQLDFAIEENVIDADAYKNALAKYEKQKQQYDRIINSINNQLDKISESLKNIAGNISQIKSNISELI